MSFTRLLRDVRLTTVARMNAAYLACLVVMASCQNRAARVSPPALIAEGLSNDDIALRMGFLNAQGKPNMGPLENIVSELSSFFAIEGAPSDPGRRVLLAHAYEAYAGLRPI